MNDFFAKHRILKALAPLVSAIILVVLLFFSPLTLTPNYSMQQLKQFATNPSSRVSFVGYSIKEQAFQNPNFLPILGSSELEHFDAFHPSVYSAKYKTAYTPFLAGQPGTQSLSQFFYVNSVASALKNRKIVFIISPQWFTPRGVQPAALEDFVSKGEIYTWLRTANPKDETTQQLAQRLLGIPDFSDDIVIDSALKSLAKGQSLNLITDFGVSSSEQFWKKEDLLFSYFSMLQTQKANPLKMVNQYAKQLPKSPNEKELENLAYQQGQANANNNKFGIANQVWAKNIKPQAARRKGTMKKVSYLQSPEYADFQQLLNQFAANHDDVEFVIPPVNGAWYKYCGLSEQTLQDFSDKITYQLQSQGFNNILDLTSKYNEPYFIGDTIHFGTRGWLAVNQGIAQFMKKPMNANYQMDNQKFLSKTWQMGKY